MLTGSGHTNRNKEPHVLCVLCCLWLRWWRRAPRSCAGWRSALLRLRKEVARMQWTCRRRSPCTWLKHGENSTLTSAVAWTEMIWCTFIFASSFLSHVSHQFCLFCVCVTVFCSRPMDAVAEGRNPAPDSLWRRYSEFELLRNYLIVTYPYIVVPPLPEKRVSSVCFGCVTVHSKTSQLSRVSKPNNKINCDAKVEMGVGKKGSLLAALAISVLSSLYS